LSACSGQQKTNNKELLETENFSEIVNWEGTYSGTVPCADCPGIDVELTLNSDFTYSMTLVYQDRQETFAYSGAFEWNDDETQITLQNASSDGGFQYYKFQDGMLVLLTISGETVTGEFADMYLLHKLESN
jgi:uncharacterized lipoprotein NlpE involved in copper resistance